jgi:16S rRNA (guanine966-N2)-methyltransferase
MANQRGKRSSQSSQKTGKHHPNRGGADPQRAAKLRIIAGTHRGRTLVYRGDPVTRPMKDRTREALFSRLGGMFQGGIAIDLFAGTGVLGFESLSRGATEAWLLELDPNAAADIRLSAKQLGFETQANIRCGDSFLLADHIIQQLQQAPTMSPWLVYFCPPYSLWRDKSAEMQQLLQRFCSTAPKGSTIIAELEEKTPVEILPNTLEWDIRLYRPAQVAIADV